MNFLETIGFWVIIIIGVVILYLTISRYKSKLNEKATLLIYGNEEIREIYNSKTRNSYYHNSEDKKIFGKVYSIKGDPYQIEKSIKEKIKELESNPDKKIEINKTILDSAEEFKKTAKTLDEEIRELELLRDKYKAFLSKNFNDSNREYQSKEYLISELMEQFKITRQEAEHVFIKLSSFNYRILFKISKEEDKYGYAKWGFNETIERKIDSFNFYYLKNY